MDKAPETIINYTMAAGGALIIFGLAIAFVGHYFLTVRNTNTSGVVKVSGFMSYLSYNFLRMILGLVVTAFVVPGLLILFLANAVPDAFLAFLTDFLGK